MIEGCKIFQHRLIGTSHSFQHVKTLVPCRHEIEERLIACARTGHSEYDGLVTCVLLARWSGKRSTRLGILRLGGTLDEVANSLVRFQWRASGVPLVNLMFQRLSSRVRSLYSLIED